MNIRSFHHFLPQCAHLLLPHQMYYAHQMPFIVKHFQFYCVNNKKICLRIQILAAFFRRLHQIFPLWKEKKMYAIFWRVSKMNFSFVLWFYSKVVYWIWFRRSSVERLDLSFKSPFSITFKRNDKSSCY